MPRPRSDLTTFCSDSIRIEESKSQAVSETGACRTRRQGVCQTVGTLQDLIKQPDIAPDLTASMMSAASCSPVSMANIIDGYRM
jgi:hypothetical protein